MHRTCCSDRDKNVQPPACVAPQESHRPIVVVDRLAGPGTGTGIATEIAEICTMVFQAERLRVRQVVAVQPGDRRGGAGGTARFPQLRVEWGR